MEQEEPPAVVTIKNGAGNKGSVRDAHDCTGQIFRPAPPFNSDFSSKLFEK